MKDYLSFLGYEVQFLKEAIKQSFMIELIKDGELWLEALSDRNLTLHSYDEAQADEIYEKIKEVYFTLSQELYLEFKEKLCMD